LDGELLKDGEDKMSEIEDVKDAIKTAIQMEKDGYSFYQKAAAQTSSDMGRTVFKSLAADELLHLEVFQKLFDERVGKEEWYNLVNTSNKYVDVPVFPKDLQRVEGANPDTNEIDALRIAMDSEQKAIEYYTKIRENSSDDEVNKIIDEIINQEKSHYFILEGEFHHINSTGYWFELDYLGPR
jgi:rubrerythrin